MSTDVNGFIPSCGEDNKITRTYKSWLDPLSFLKGTSGIGGTADIGQISRRHTPQTIEYFGISEETAKKYVDDNPASTTYDADKKLTTIIKNVAAERDGEGGYYKVVIESETVTDWA